MDKLQEEMPNEDWELWEKIMARLQLLKENSKQKSASVREDQDKNVNSGKDVVQTC